MSETVLMYGPGISNPEVIVEREVPLCDVNAYMAAGYRKGPNPDKVFAIQGVTYSLEDSIAQLADDEPAPKRGKKK